MLSLIDGFCLMEHVGVHLNSMGLKEWSHSSHQIVDENVIGKFIIGDGLINYFLEICKGEFILARHFLLWVALSSLD